MEYLIGALLTIGIVLIANRVLVPAFKETSKTRIRYSQSHVYNLMAPLMEYAPKPVDKKDTQARKHMKQAYVRVVIMDDQAYWIKDNALYTAELVDGMVDKETTRLVDTMSMDTVQLDKTMFVVEKLREGLENEDRTSG